MRVWFVTLPAELPVCGAVFTLASHLDSRREVFLELFESLQTHSSSPAATPADSTLPSVRCKHACNPLWQGDTVTRACYLHAPC